jgi:hypothetical protein
MNKRSLLIIICFIFILLPAALYAQEETSECTHPRVTYLMEKTGAPCQEILDLVAAGVGYGRIMKSVVIAEGLPGYNGDWRALLDSHRQGQGWGEVTHAYGLSSRFSDLRLGGKELLALKESGLGWGPIIHAQSLATADIGLSFNEAIGMLQKGLGWGEIRDELGLPPGPPPWASDGNSGKGVGNSDSGNGPGNSDNAKGAGNSDDGNGPGNSGNAKGAGNSDDGNGPGNSGNAKGAGNSDNGNGPGNSGNAKGAGNSDNAKGAGNGNNGNGAGSGNNGNGAGSGDNGGEEDIFKITGSVTVISETLWIIDGETITIAPETRIEAGIEVGDLVEAEVWLTDDSSPTAQEIKLAGSDNTEDGSGDA